MNAATDDGNDRLKVLRMTREAYDRLRDANKKLSEAERHHWPKLEPVAVTFKQAPPHDDRKARDLTLELYDKAGDQGWVRHRSVAYRLRDNSDAENTALGEPSDAGPPIAGEWVLPNDLADPTVRTSVHLRPHATEPGMLAQWTYTERPLADGEVLRKGEWPALCQRVAVLPHPWAMENVPAARFDAAAKAPADPASDAGPGRPSRQRRPASVQEILIYHVYWGTAPGDEDKHALRRLFARFAGFCATDTFDREPIVMGRQREKKPAQQAERGGNDR